MRCAGCGYDNQADAAFCEECGAAIDIHCPQCGQALRAAAKFCRKCGHRIAPEAGEPAGSAGPAPRQYTPRHLAERILTSRSALEGERKQVTVLFCDIADSSGLAERLDPEVMHELMDRTLRLMAEAVHRYQGTVNQFLGDGLMALFGAPVALEDHAVRAVQAAVAIRETIGGYSEQLRGERGIELRLRQGLNTGLVVVGRIGDDLRMDYTAVGDTTHLAARVQTLAEPGTILITEATQRLAEGYIRSEPVGPVPIRGRTDPVPVYRVIGRQLVRTRLELSAQRGLTPLVGREREVALLRERLEAARAGRGQVVGLMGEPGAGKSRLLYEFRQGLGEERLIWLAGNCVSFGQATPYLPILDVLRANFQIEEDDNPLQIREKLRAGLRPLDLEASVPFLGELFGLRTEDPRLREMDAKDRRQKIFEAAIALTAAGSARRPLVVIIEDLHWIDRTSEDYLAFAAQRLGALSVLLVVTHRPGYAPRWADLPYYTPITLDLLTPPQAESMVATLLGSRQLPDDLLGMIWQKAEGNPLFVEEMTRSLLERALLVPAEGGYRWAREAAVVELPASVQDIIRARIDALEEPVKRMVQTAAVIGREFGLRLLARISDVRAEVDGYLETLKDLELIHETRFFPELEYIFKHAVTQDVAYQSLLVQRRRELHGIIGRAIEELYADRLDEHAAILAHHYARSLYQDKAMLHGVAAGDRAVRLYANPEARAHYEQALAIAATLPASADRDRTLVDIAVKQAAISGSREEFERDRANLERARDLAVTLDDAPRQARALYWLGRLSYVLGAFQRSLDYAGQSLEIADRLGDEALAAPPVNLMGRVYWNWTEFPRAGKMLERSVEQMRGIGNRTEEATAAGAAGFVMGCMGEFERALAYADRGVDLAREIQNPFAEAAALQNRGFVLEHRGRLDASLREYALARRIAQGIGDRFRVYIIEILEGRAMTLAGDPVGGRALLDSALAFAQQIGTKFFLGWQKTCLAGCLLVQGDAAAARGLAREAIGLAGETGERFIRALAQRTDADALACLDASPPGLDEAEVAYREVVAVLGEIGARPELARSYAGWASLLRARGDRARADELAERARALFVEMDLGWDLDRLAAATRGVS